MLSQIFRTNVLSIYNVLLLVYMLKFGLTIQSVTKRFTLVFKSLEIVFPIILLLPKLTYLDLSY